MLFDQLLPAATIFRPTFKHGVPQVDILGVCDGCLFWCNGCMYQYCDCTDSALQHRLAKYPEKRLENSSSDT